MAAKIKEGLRDIKDGLVNKFAGPKYADNLLGESLQVSDPTAFVTRFRAPRGQQHRYTTIKQVIRCPYGCCPRTRAEAKLRIIPNGCMCLLQ